MRDFFTGKKIKTLALILLAAAVVAVSSYLMKGRAGFFTNAVEKASAPFQQAATSIAGWLENVYGYIYEHDKSVAENEDLRVRLAEAEEALRQAKVALEENAVLRELLNLAEKHSDFEFESTKIVSWNSSNWSSSFVISKGSSNGIEIGDCVVTEFGALVGQVIEVGDTWATVRTIIDVDMSVGALVGEAGNAAMIIGEFQLMQRGMTKLMHLTEGTQLFEGDTILTSGKGGYFPQGLIVGKIVSVETEAGGQTPYAVVEPACDLSSLAQIFVVKEFYISE